MKTDLRVALLGVAYPHADFWMRGWKSVPEVSVAAVWDHDQARGEAFASRHGLSFTADLDGVLGRTDVDAIAIGAENNRHAQLSILAIEANKHVLCDKPMAITLTDCDRVISKLEKKSVSYVPAFPMRVDPNNLAIRELLEDGAIGRVSTVHKKHGLGWAVSDAIPRGWEWFADVDQSGGGAFLDESVHAADFLRWLFGDPVSVTAHIGHVQSLVSVDNNGVAIYRFRDGMYAVLEASWTWVASAYTTEIHGDQGTIVQSFTDLASTSAVGESSFPIRVYSRGFPNGGWWHPYPSKPLHFKRTHDAMAICFARSLLHDAPVPATAEDGRKALEMVLAAYESARTGSTISFPLTEVTA